MSADMLSRSSYEVYTAKDYFNNSEEPEIEVKPRARRFSGFLPIIAGGLKTSMNNLTLASSEDPPNQQTFFSVFKTGRRDSDPLDAKLQRIEKLAPSTAQKSGSHHSHTRKAIMKQSMGIDDKPEAEEELAAINSKLNRINKLAPLKGIESSSEQRRGRTGIMQTALGIDQRAPEKDEETIAKLDRISRLPKGRTQAERPHANVRATGIMQTALGIDQIGPEKDEETIAKLDRISRLPKGRTTMERPNHSNARATVLKDAIGTQQQDGNDISMLSESLQAKMKKIEALPRIEKGSERKATSKRVGIVRDSLGVQNEKSIDDVTQSKLNRLKTSVTKPMVQTTSILGAVPSIGMMGNVNDRLKRVQTGKLPAGKPSNTAVKKPLRSRGTIRGTILQKKDMKDISVQPSSSNEKEPVSHRTAPGLLIVEESEEGEEIEEEEIEDAIDDGDYESIENDENAAIVASNTKANSKVVEEFSVKLDEKDMDTIFSKFNRGAEVPIEEEYDNFEETRPSNEDEVVQFVDEEENLENEDKETAVEPFVDEQ